MFTFRNAQYEYNLFDLYAAPEIAQHLEALAQQGWQLEHIGPVFWRYRKCPPADLHYAVVYFPKDPADEYISRQQRELWELCRTTGWELAATAGQMQIFRTAEKEPIPIETDPVVQMETIHAAMRVRDSVLFAGSLIFYILLLLPLLLLTRSAGNRAAWFRLFLPALLLYILPCCITLVSHLLWYHSAWKTAQNENRLQAPKGNRRLNAVHTILALICLFLFLFSVIAERNYYLATLTGAVIPGTIFLLAVYFRLRHRLQQRGRRTAAAFLMAAFALELVLSLGYTAAHPIILGHRNAECITQSVGGSTFLVDKIYHDPLPLTVEDLTGETSDINYSCFFEVRGTPLLRQYVGRQLVPLFQGSSQPALAYSVFVGSAYFLDRRLTELRQGAYSAFHPVEQISFTELDASRWGAEAAYRSADGSLHFLLRYADRLVDLQFFNWPDATVKPMQAELVRERLGCGALA